MVDFLHAGPTQGPLLMLAHGAGAPMDSTWMNEVAEALAVERIGTVRFEFAYMAGRRQGTRKPPPKAEKLVDEYLAAVDQLKTTRPLAIGGKSMGGRVASLVADQLFEAGRIGHYVCLSYPFHPPGAPEKLRTAHLVRLRTPSLICQGERDPFGSRPQVETYPLSAAINIAWMPDGDHDLKPRKAVTGLTQADNLRYAAKRVAAFLAGG